MRCVAEGLALEGFTPFATTFAMFANTCGGAPGAPGGKKAKIRALVEQQDGATLTELLAATGWQAPGVRRFISGSLTKKMG